MHVCILQKAELVNNAALKAEKSKEHNRLLHAYSKMSYYFCSGYTKTVLNCKFIVRLQKKHKPRSMQPWKLTKIYSSKIPSYGLNQK